MNKRQQETYKRGVCMLENLIEELSSELRDAFSENERLRSSLCEAEISIKQLEFMLGEGK